VGRQSNLKVRLLQLLVALVREGDSVTVVSLLAGEGALAGHCKPHTFTRQPAIMKAGPRPYAPACAASSGGWSDTSLVSEHSTPTQPWKLPLLGGADHALRYYGSAGFAAGATLFLAPPQTVGRTHSQREGGRGQRRRGRCARRSCGGTTMTGRPRRTCCGMQ
jgi:hypothetical protein